MKTIPSFIQSLALLFILIAATANAAVESVSYRKLEHQEKRWQPASGECGITRFSSDTYHDEWIDEFDTPGIMLGALNTSIIETSDPKCLANYGVVQFVRGCVYNVVYDPDTKTTETLFNVYKNSRDKEVVFRFPNWIVDTVDEDPLYYSSPSNTVQGGRLASYMWTSPALASQNDSASMMSDHKQAYNRNRYNFWREAAPKVDQTFVKTITGSANYLYPLNMAPTERALVTNVSLEFKTCVYRLSDVPTEGNPKFPDVPANKGGPLACFDWNLRERFNFERFNYDTLGAIDPLCR